MKQVVKQGQIHNTLPQELQLSINPLLHYLFVKLNSLKISDHITVTIITVSYETMNIHDSMTITPTQPYHPTYNNNPHTTLPPYL